MIQEARDKLALANRILAHEGVLDAFGHVSFDTHRTRESICFPIFGAVHGAQRGHP